MTRISAMILKMWKCVYQHRVVPDNWFGGKELVASEKNVDAKKIFPTTKTAQPEADVKLHGKHR